ncbi:unnamed protein product [Parnassius apollo]|uniref:(apollo) hypothetical protein n=1 Tax=Parnassius apollo TaxID=110799 RepID=A0A8S3W0X3_PARAO|nr:unnamed protein product [Parnassius apollo]
MRRFNKLDWNALGELSEEELSFDINKEAELNDARKNPSFISDSSTTTSESSPLLEDFGVTQGLLGHEESNYDKETLVLNVASLKQISECKTSKSTGKKIQSSCETNREKGRSLCVNNWKDMKRKAAVNSGQQYVSRNEFPPYSIMETIRGTRIICVEGYRFSRKKDKKTSHSLKMRWRCYSHHRNGCTATLYTVEERIVSMKNIHNHSPPPRTLPYQRNALMTINLSS